MLETSIFSFDHNVFKRLLPVYSMIKDYSYISFSMKEKATLDRHC